MNNRRTKVFPTGVKDTKIIAYMGLLIALDIVITRFASIAGPTFRVGFGFVPMSITGYLLGPVLGIIEGGLADLIRIWALPTGAFIWGFTVSAMVRGLIYGVFLFRCRSTGWKLVVRCILCSLAATLIVDLGLNSYWLIQITGAPYWVNMLNKIVTPTTPVNFVLSCATMPFYIAFMQRNARRILHG